MPVLGIVENMSYFTPPDLPDRKYYIFGKGGGARVAQELGVDFLGEVPIDPRVVEGGDQGKPILAYAPDSPAAPRAARDRREDRRASSPCSASKPRRSPTRTSPGSAERGRRRVIFRQLLTR